ncbi:2Fe-2S iron-sulfur cluster-binding protein [Brevibacillus daliensis]|uniref:2Fe-2S iron-sulfur cluster-binding protein n=1 Tax=Brevibacillus daliensis TaxID=2892995 RepID=UPI001E5CCB86|nr:2Fe-2S iron-sulfur cluster-binding protein [Brevibacillus daliensis]
MSLVTFLPSKRTYKARKGQNLLQIARAARVIIPTRCHGQASCLMCKVKIEAGAVGPPTDKEKRKLSAGDLKEGIRLSCQTIVTDEPCTVRIPEDRLKSVVQRALERQHMDQDDW